MKLIPEIREDILARSIERARERLRDVVGRDDGSCDRAALARNLSECFLKQFFELGLFHADPHPGNLFVHPLERGGDNGGLPGRPFLLVFVDFGMVQIGPLFFGDS